MDAELKLVILAVSDLRRAVSFYQQAFGWPQTVDERVYAEFSMSEEQRLGLYERTAFGANIGRTPAKLPVGEVGGTELYFYVDAELPSAIARLEAVGARMLSKLAPRDWGDEAAYFADPDGNVLVLARPTKEASKA